MRNTILFPEMKESCILELETMHFYNERGVSALLHPITTLKIFSFLPRKYKTLMKTS